MPIHKTTLRWRFRYVLLMAGLLFLLINHISVLLGDPWFIPDFLRIY